MRDWYGPDSDEEAAAWAEVERRAALRGDVGAVLQGEHVLPVYVGFAGLMELGLEIDETGEPHFVD